MVQQGVKKRWHGGCNGGCVRIAGAGKDRSKEMPKPPKPTLPKVDLREDELKEIRVNVRTSVHDCIIQYIAFHEESMRSRPTESKVVDRGMEEFFKSDEAFQAYLKKREKSGNEPAQRAVLGEGKKGGEVSNAGRLNAGRGTSLQGE
jgi:hypothetical protein